MTAAFALSTAWEVLPSPRLGFCKRGERWRQRQVLCGHCWTAWDGRDVWVNYSGWCKVMVKPGPNRLGTMSISSTVLVWFVLFGMLLVPRIFCSAKPSAGFDFFGTAAQRRFVSELWITWLSLCGHWWPQQDGRGTCWLGEPVLF